jgi:hypothetical protein
MRASATSIGVIGLLCASLAGCGDRGGETTPPRYAFLTPGEQLVRASMAIRGLRPFPSEVLAVREDPAAVDGIVRSYLQSPEFLETVRDMHAEMFLLRTDIDDQLPATGLLEDVPVAEINFAMNEETLKLVEHVVGLDRPYTEIVTAKYVVANATLATIYGLPYDPTGPEWQETHYQDGRPEAGVLTTTEPYRRYESNGSNFHRGRANLWATQLLCESFADRDVEVEGGVDLSDPEVVAHAVETNPTCIGCHEALDPLAVNFFGFRRFLTGRLVDGAEMLGCDAIYGPDNGEEEHTLMGDGCYPLKAYTPANELDWITYDLRPPGYYGKPVDGLPDVAREMAADPRFASCAVRQHVKYLGQIDLDEVAPPFAARLQEGFVADAYNVRELVYDIVTSDAFRATRALDPNDPEPAVPLQVVRPEAYARIIQQLTGFVWRAAPDKSTCSVDDDCWGEVDLGRSDLDGFRAMAGGVDGLNVTVPSHTPTPTQMLVMSRFSAEAAAYVVERDFAAAPPYRNLLSLVPDDFVRDEATVRAALADQSLRILASVVDPQGPEVGELYGVFTKALVDHPEDPSTRTAWTIAIAALLQDPAVLYY